VFFVVSFAVLLLTTAVDAIAVVTKALGASRAQSELAAVADALAGLWSRTVTVLLLLLPASGAEHEGLESNREEAARNLSSTALEQHIETSWESKVDDDTELLDSVQLYLNGLLAVYTTATKLN
jgi:hypothetical protein